MEQCEDLGHKNQNNEDAGSTEERYYVPRHAVYKSSKVHHTLVLFWLSHVVPVTDSELYDSNRIYSTTMFVFHRFTIQNIPNCIHRR